MENIKESVHTLRNVWNVTNRVHCIIASGSRFVAVANKSFVKFTHWDDFYATRDPSECRI